MFGKAQDYNIHAFLSFKRSIHQELWGMSFECLNIVSPMFLPINVPGGRILSEAIVPLQQVFGVFLCASIVQRKELGRKLKRIIQAIWPAEQNSAAFEKSKA